MALLFGKKLDPPHGGGIFGPGGGILPFLAKTPEIEIFAKKHGFLLKSHKIDNMAVPRKYPPIVVLIKFCIRNAVLNLSKTKRILHV